MPRFLRPASTYLAVAACLLATLLGTAPARAATPSPGSPARLHTIEALAAYEPQTSCDPHIKPGVTALAKLLLATYPDTSYGSARNCATSTSEHYEGRALDWMVSVRVPAKKAEAQAVLTWLFATDSDGNKDANLRRLGVMYVVWNNRIWGTWDQKWQPYQNCANEPQKSMDDACHRSHIHFSLTWEGALKQTSFWTQKVAARNYGPCIATDLNWAYRYAGHARSTACPRHAQVTAPKGASALARNLVTYSGARADYGESGPVVAAVQQAIGATADGDFGPATRTKLLAWQRAHHLSATDTVNYATWRALLAAYVK